MKVNIQLLVKCIVGIVVGAAALILLQMWFHPFGELIFWKMIATLVILGLLVSFLIAIKQDLAEDKKLKDDKFID